MTGKVIDRIEMKGRAALEYGAEGVVVIFHHDKPASPPTAGEPVLLVRHDGWMFLGNAEDVRSEPEKNAAGLFLRGLHVTDVPVGAAIRWGSDVVSMQSVAARSA